MIRYTYIKNQVLSIYSSMDKIEFPINIEQIIMQMHNCRYLSYQDFAKINSCSIDDVIQICESKSGCTHYDVSNDRYLILSNQSTENNNNTGRQLWTLAHELGHVICNHHAISTFEKLSENNLYNPINPEYELEADFFTATFLAPFPFFKPLEVKSTIDVQNVFGLSTEASIYRYKQYLKWLNSKTKTSWENDMLRVFNQKSIK